MGPVELRQLTSQAILICPQLPELGNLVVPTGCSDSTWMIGLGSAEQFEGGHPSRYVAGVSTVQCS